MNKGLNNLMAAMIEAAKGSAQDEYGPRVPQWVSLTRLEGLFCDNTHREIPVGVKFTVRTPEDPSRSSNGGDYWESVRFGFLPDGRVYSQEHSSCELTEDSPKEVFDLIVSLSAIEQMAELACQKVLAELAPPPLDLKKIRRRVEDALRKTATASEILAVAGLLKVKTE